MARISKNEKRLVDAVTGRTLSRHKSGMVAQKKAKQLADKTGHPIKLIDDYGVQFTFHPGNKWQHGSSNPKRKRSNSWWNRTKSTIKGNRYMVMDSDGLPVHTGRDLTKTAALKIAKEARAAGEKVKLVKSNPSRSNKTTFPAHVRINPRTGKTQVFVTPQVANRLRGVKGLRVAGASNPTSSPYYWEKEGGLWVMRQKRFKKQRHTRGGEGHPHDIMAYAHSAKEAREMQEKYLGGKFGKK